MLAFKWWSFIRKGKKKVFEAKKWRKVRGTLKSQGSFTTCRHLRVVESGLKWSEWCILKDLDHKCWEQSWTTEKQTNQTRQQSLKGDGLVVTSLTRVFYHFWLPLKFFISVWYSKFVPVGYVKARLNGNWAGISFKLLILCVVLHTNQTWPVKRQDVISSRSCGAVNRSSSAWGDCLELTLSCHFAEFLAVVECFLQRSRAKPPVNLRCHLTNSK